MPNPPPLRPWQYRPTTPAEEKLSSSSGGRRDPSKADYDDDDLPLERDTAADGMKAGDTLDVPAGGMVLLGTVLGASNLPAVEVKTTSSSFPLNLAPRPPIPPLSTHSHSRTHMHDTCRTTKPTGNVFSGSCTW